MGLEWAGEGSVVIRGYPEGRVDSDMGAAGDMERGLDLRGAIPGLVWWEGRPGEACFGEQVVVVAEVYLKDRGTIIAAKGDMGSWGGA